ncbi:hypothetical protein C8C85_1591 [Flavobacterium sp. 103]|nr:hypothetical protein C8C85_1591 [Flavobacterium sp. 103]
MKCFLYKKLAYFMMSKSRLSATYNFFLAKSPKEEFYFLVKRSSKIRFKSNRYFYSKAKIVRFLR